MSLSKNELDILSIMYEGDKNRDASEKIRGFLFQDYVAIMCLLQDNVQSVFLEYLEDVDVLYTDSTFDLIQVKYFPKTSPKMEEISTDLYYQYLRLQLLHCSLTTNQKLYIHRDQKVDKPSEETMRKYVGLGEKLPKTKIYPDSTTSRTWLKDNVHIHNKKIEQKKKLFEAMASKSSMNQFVRSFTIKHLPNIEEYREELKKTLVNRYPVPANQGDERNWSTILLGLAVIFIQKRYRQGKSDYEKLRFDKAEFESYMTQSVQINTEETISSYLVGNACRVYETIINHNELSDLQNEMLIKIYILTCKWLVQTTNSIEGQRRLLNTISMQEASAVSSYVDKDIPDRLIQLAESCYPFERFLKYLWKIMIDICQDTISNEEVLQRNLQLLDPSHYVDASVTDYICLNFPEDKTVNYCAIFPPGEEFNCVKRVIIQRMINLSPRPEKWLFANHSLAVGKNIYDYSTANVNEMTTVVDLGQKCFYIECMDCIKTDEGYWNVQDRCNDCIFVEKCVKER